MLIAEKENVLSLVETKMESRCVFTYKQVNMPQFTLKGRPRGTHSHQNGPDSMSDFSLVKLDGPHRMSFLKERVLGLKCLGTLPNS